MQSLIRVIAAPVLLASTALAQTFPGFTPSTSSNLVTIYHPEKNNVTTLYRVSPPGELFTDESIVASAPYIGLPDNVSSDVSKYLVVMVDTDLELPGSSTTQILLHYLQSDLQLSHYIPEDNLTILLPANDASSVTGDYLSPTPSGSTAHHYQFVLYRQPANFSLPADFDRFLPPITSVTVAGVQHRLGFNFTHFQQETALGAPVAANWLRVQKPVANATASASGTAPAASAKATGTTMAYVSGAVGNLALSGGAGILGGLGLLLGGFV